MRLLVLGQVSKEEQRFLDHAVHVGYHVSVLISTLDESLSEAHVTVLHEPLLTEEKLSRALTNVDAVIVTASCAKNRALVRTVAQHMQDQYIRRLIIVTRHLDQSALISDLKLTAIDWTIVQHTKQKSSLSVSIKDLARFVVSQITEAQHVGSAVLVTN